MAVVGRGKLTRRSSDLFLSRSDCDAGFSSERMAPPGGRAVSASTKSVSALAALIFPIQYVKSDHIEPNDPHECHDRACLNSCAPVNGSIFAASGSAFRTARSLLLTLENLATGIRNEMRWPTPANSRHHAADRRSSWESHRQEREPAAIASATQEIVTSLRRRAASSV